MGATDRTFYRSVAGSIAVDALTKQILTVGNTLLALPRFGGEIEPMTGLQGSFRPRTPYSGTTHTGCAAVDLSPYNWRNRLIVLDLLGADYMHRLKSEGDWPEHGHTMTRGLGCAAESLKWQLDQVRHGYSGLASGSKDRDAALRSGLWTLAVYQGRTGRLKASRGTHLMDGPSSTRTRVQAVKAGEMVTAIMEVRNRAGNLWFVTDQGLWGASAKWVKA